MLYSAFGDMTKMTDTDLLDYNEYAPTGKVAGTIKVLPRLYSSQLDNWRDILIYLPPGYQSTRLPYPVVYMHDGQNLFDVTTSYSGEWFVDETLEQLSHAGLEAIVVGIPNTGDERMNEYGPFVNVLGQGGRGEAYLSFIIETLKPLIDSRFRTLADREHTTIMGSSMGGLISLYAGFRYPEVFSRIGAMSPSLWFAGGAIFSYIQDMPFVESRIYLDIGTLEGGSSSVNKLLRNSSKRRNSGNAFRMQQLLIAKGYRLDYDLMFVEEEGGIHHESSWARRLPDALRFLLQAEPPAAVQARARQKKGKRKTHE